MSSFGFDFRASSGFVSDPSTCTYVVESTTYPTTRTVNGVSVTFGITQQTAGQSRDRDAGIDARLAGEFFSDNADATKLKFRVDLPSAGTYTIRLALGDYNNARNNTLKIWDNTTLKTTVSGASSSGGFTDAGGVDRTAAAWPGSNTSINVTFATTTAIFELAPAGAGDITSLAHIFIASAATPATLSSPTPNYLGSLTITGTNFPTSQSGSAGITIGGVAQTVTWNTSTSCSISSIDIGTNKFGTSVDIVVTDASGNASTGYATTFSPRSGGASVDLSGTMASSGVRLVASPDIAAGDQIEYYGAIGGTIPADVTVNNDGTYDTAAAVTGFYWRVWTAGGGWGTAAFETVEAVSTGSSETSPYKQLFKSVYRRVHKWITQ